MLEIYTNIMQTPQHESSVQRNPIAVVLINIQAVLDQYYLVQMAAVGHFECDFDFKIQVGVTGVLRG